jgi:hypothetical protein
VVFATPASLSPEFTSRDGLAIPTCTGTNLSVVRPYQDVALLTPPESEANLPPKVSSCAPGVLVLITTTKSVAAEPNADLTLLALETLSGLAANVILDSAEMAKFVPPSTSASTELTLVPPIPLEPVPTQLPAPSPAVALPGSPGMPLTTAFATFARPTSLVL